MPIENSIKIEEFWVDVEEKGSDEWCGFKSGLVKKFTAACEWKKYVQPVERTMMEKLFKCNFYNFKFAFATNSVERF